MVVVDLSGKVVEGERNPSIPDPPVPYQNSRRLGGHTIRHGQPWAQPKGIPCLGTTHADTFMEKYLYPTQRQQKLKMNTN